MRKTAFIVLYFTLLSASPAYAVGGVGDVVFDPQAFQRQLTNYALQVQQYQTQMNQYRIQFANMQNLNYQTDLSGLYRMQQVMQQAVGISNDYNRMQTQFQQTYPDFKTYQGQKGTDYVMQSTQWSQTNQRNAYDMLTVTTRLQESLKQDQSTLTYLNKRSDSAAGTKDLQQTTNQILITNTKQLMQLQDLMATSAKADAAYLAQQSSEREASRGEVNDIMRDWKNPEPKKKAPYLWEMR